MDTSNKSAVDRRCPHGKEKAKKFTPEQRAAAVKIVETSGKPIAQIAREMDLSVTALRNWVTQSKVDKAQDPKGPLTSDERAELARLRRDLKRVTMERDFLKRAAAYFAKETAPSK